MGRKKKIDVEPTMRFGKHRGEDAFRSPGRGAVLPLLVHGDGGRVRRGEEVVTLDPVHDRVAVPGHDAPAPTVQGEMLGTAGERDAQVLNPGAERADARPAPGSHVQLGRSGRHRGDVEDVLHVAMQHFTGRSFSATASLGWRR